MLQQTVDWHLPEESKHTEYSSHITKNCKQHCKSNSTLRLLAILHLWYDEYRMFIGCVLHKCSLPDVLQTYFLKALVCAAISQKTPFVHKVHTLVGLQRHCVICLTTDALEDHCRIFVPFLYVCKIAGICHIYKDSHSQEWYYPDQPMPEGRQHYVKQQYRHSWQCTVRFHFFWYSPPNFSRRAYPRHPNSPLTSGILECWIDGAKFEKKCM